MFVIKTVETTKSYDDREKLFDVKRCFNIVVECYKYVIHRFIPPKKIRFSSTVFTHSFQNVVTLMHLIDLMIDFYVKTTL